jgi:hypothetical protein
MFQSLSELGGVAGTRDDHVEPVQRVLAKVVVRDLAGVLAEELDQHVGRLRALDLERPDVRLADLDVQARVVRDAHRPEQHVAVGDRDPEAVLLQPQQDRVVDDPAVRRRDEDVLALADRALVQVARDEHVREREGVRPRDLDLALDADVPQRHPVHELPVLLDRVAVVAGVVHVVVDAVDVHAVAARGVEVRRLPDPRVEQDVRVLDDGHWATSRS